MYIILYIYIYIHEDGPTPPLWLFVMRTEYEDMFGVAALWSRKTAEGRAEVSRKGIYIMG